MRNLGGIVVCFILVMFSLPLMAQNGPELSMPDLSANSGDSVTLPVTYTANGNNIAAIVFSVDFDEANLIFDDTNTTGLPFPDSITVNPMLNPFIFTISVTYDATDTDGELDFTFADFTQPFTALPEGDLATITFTAGNATVVAPVNFSQSPVASFGNTAGDSVAGTTVDGSVSITGTAACGDGNQDAGEDCDEGTANGSTVCGCQTNCILPTAGTSCDDGLFCNAGETCDGAGTCGGGSPLDCGDGISCTIDSCNESTDSCDNVADDGLCDNGLFCDGAETCDPVNDCQAGTSPCNPATETCNEGNDVCEPLPTGCQLDAECDDGAFCNGAETCDTGTGDCKAGTPVDVDDGVACTDDSCDEANDVVVNTANDVNCDNGQFCDGAETCDAINDCQAGTSPCNPATETCNEGNDVCEPLPTGCQSDAECDDGAFCNGAETCDTGTGDCKAGTPVDVDDGVACTDDSCDEVNDTVVNTANDANCDNGQFCDGSETCDQVNDCQAGNPPCDPETETCNEGNDVCGPLPTGCQSDAECDDSAFCNGAETCDATGKCKAGTDPCAPGETCDEANDICVMVGADVLLTKLKAPESVKVKKGEAKNTKIKAFGMIDTLAQKASVNLTVNRIDAVTVNIKPASRTKSLKPGDDPKEFKFKADISCNEIGTWMLQWTATIDAPQNADTSNDTMTASTIIPCM